jgi:hypothetical protein
MASERVRVQPGPENERIPHNDNDAAEKGPAEDSTFMGGSVVELNYSKSNIN